MGRSALIFLRRDRALRRGKSDGPVLVFLIPDGAGRPTEETRDRELRTPAPTQTRHCTHESAPIWPSSVICERSPDIRDRPTLLRRARDGINLPSWTLLELVRRRVVDGLQLHDFELTQAGRQLEVRHFAHGLPEQRAADR
jgi:hypothetical protein